MIPIKPRICKGNCSDKPKPIFSHGYCRSCAQKLNYKPLKRSPIKKNHKATGELALFKEIWNERPHICERCGEKLYEFSHKNYHHIKGKGKYPGLRLVKSNITQICFDCHYAAHFGNSIVPLD